MEILKETDFKKELKNPKNGYLLFGEEDYLKAFTVKSLTSALSPDPTYAFFNEMHLDALNYSPQALLDALAPLPMMADKKIVTLSGLNFTTMKSSEIDDLCEILAELPNYDYNVLVVSVSADAFDPGYLPKRPGPTLTKLSQYLTPVQYERCSPARLNAWVEKHFSHNGVSASPELCAFMTDYCGRSMYQLSSEIDKLSFYELYHQRTVATIEDLKTVCTPVTEYDAFDFANAMMEGQREKALAILSDYKFRRVDPLTVLGDVIRIFCDMISVDSMTKDGCPTAQIASVLKLHEFKVGLYQKALRNGISNRLNRALTACKDADSALKLSVQGYSALERLICSL